MFQDTRPAELGPAGGEDRWGPFRVSQPQERLRLLRELCAGSVPVNLNASDGSVLNSTLWVVDASQNRLSFSADPTAPQLSRVVDAAEAVAVAYLDSVKLQFDAGGLMLVHGRNACSLQCRLPHEVYRFQRRHAFRVRPKGMHDPLVALRHPSMPEMVLSLRVLDVSIGGCALWLPHDVPPMQAGTQLGQVRVELDPQTRFSAALALQHVSSQGSSSGARLGCEWRPLASDAERMLQRWIDRTQQRRRLLAAE